MTDELKSQYRTMGDHNEGIHAIRGESPADRRCGDCKACCTILGVPALDKPKNTQCKFECRKGCSDYVNRPEECVAFKCAWLLGVGGLKDRPDRSRLMINGHMATDEAGVRRIMVYPLSPGDWKRDRPQKIINRMRPYFDVIVIEEETRKLFKRTE